MRREGPIIFGLIAGLVVIVSNFFTVSGLPSIKTELDRWFLISQAFMILVGVINLTQVHAAKIKRKKREWWLSVVMFAGLSGFIVFGLARGGTTDPLFQKVYLATIVPMNATVVSTLGFYVASASYRSFRVRSKEATVLLICAFTMMLGKVPLGEGISSAIPKFASWLFSYPTTAAMRGIAIGATLGGTATALRVLLGIERSHLGTTE